MMGLISGRFMFSCFSSRVRCIFLMLAKAAVYGISAYNTIVEIVYINIVIKIKILFILLHHKISRSCREIKTRY